MKVTDPPPLVVDLFAGPGGWDEGLRALDMGCRVVGVEWEANACRTAKAAGHERIRADVTALNPADFAGATGVIAGTKTDNRPENLELWVGPIRAGQRAKDVTCPHCGEQWLKDVPVAGAAGRGAGAASSPWWDGLQRADGIA